MTKSTRTTQRDSIARFFYTDTEHTPSWKRYGQGQATMEISSHLDNPYLSFVATESNLSANGSSKTTMVSLDAEQGRSLYRWLSTIYGPVLP